MGLIQLSEKWSKIDFIDLAEKTLLEMDDFIADLNRKQLSDKGVREDGSKITPEYSFNTKDYKSDRGGISGIIDHVTLYDKGDVHKSILADIYSGKLLLDATDPKVPKLLEDYGEWLGLTDESLALLQNEFRPRYVSNIIKALQ